ncbi:MAG: tetratricopeptide repeat protein, partial [Gemmatimonadetes bacterium]|nr:tetratricopeptide repeat protein [Gemmatimonadota bacterium]
MSKSTLSTDGSFRRSALLLVLLVGVIYSASLRAGFHYDDFHSIVRNPHLSLTHLTAFFVDPGLFSVNPESAMYRPLLLTTYALNRLISAGDAWSYHLINVILHAASTIVVCRLLRLLGSSFGISVLAAVLFAVHPINSEAVAYVSSRSELLASLGILLFCCLVLTSSQKGRTGLMAIGCLAAAIASKAVAIVSPLLALLGLAHAGRLKADRRSLQVIILSGVLLLGYLLIVQNLVSRAFVDAPVRGLSSQMATQLKALGYYLWLMVMPVHLSVEHQFAVSRDFELVVGVAAACVGSLLVLGWRARYIWRWGSAWWFVCLLPTAAVPLIVLVNEHRLYGASVGVMALIACVLGGQTDRRRMADGWIAVYTISLAILTIQRVDVWHSERSVWQDAAIKAPASLKAQLRWADALAKDGEVAQAEEAYLRAVALRPHHPGARNNLGRLYLLQGRWDEARHQFETLLNVSPDNLPARMNLGQIHFRQGRPDAAKVQYLAAIDLGATRGRAQLRIAQIGLRHNADAYSILTWLERAVAAGESSIDVQVSRGIVLRRLGRLQEARMAYESAVAIDASSADAWYNLGNLYVELNRDQKAVHAYGLAAE